MRFSRLALTGIGMAAGAAVAFTGSGEASAALLLPSSYPHTQSLTNGTLTVNVGNETSKTATCWLSIHDASKETQLGLRVAAVNAIIASGIESTVLDNARADAAAGALRIVWSGQSVAKDSSATGTWVSNRSDTSYAIYQECTTPDPITGLTINGLAQVYKVTGTGKPADNGGGDNDGGDNGGGDNGGGDNGGGDNGGGDNGGGDNGGGDKGGGDSGNGSLGNLFGSS
ncbi:hypothetical protein [Gordonia alkanivorans]|uniref:hypothetical protein n=1 Tax=Gordonia alkanivorans TaxID=84096 RepID=UPI00244D0A3D|nr:hypothetical protein [Gordonia alkanivorans]MDH3007152.1 hypothetical protein [Gordonia alkanivorans]MDH3017045.1 hypothetical protein [Gordonia alkanivorans]MDH3042208.1 hypothetical protein [Gordonia alkanivorans]MDH3061010.1 hypothetical protein [Gordonia alkanivorans]